MFILLCLLSSHIKFRITGGIDKKNTNKLFFMLTSNYKKSIIAFFYLFDFFEDPVIFLNGYNNL